MSLASNCYVCVCLSLCSPPGSTSHSALDSRGDQDQARARGLQRHCRCVCHLLTLICVRSITVVCLHVSTHDVTKHATNSLATWSTPVLTRNLTQGLETLSQSLGQCFGHDGSCDAGLLLPAAEAIKTYVTDSHLEAQQLVQQQHAEVER